MNIPSLPSALLDPIVAKAHKNRELFRLHATQAYQEFTPQNRHVVASLETQDIAAYSFFATWTQQTAPALKQLEQQVQDASFLEDLASRLLLDPASTSQKLDSLITQRRSELHDELLECVYSESHDNPKRLTQARQQAALLLRLDDTSLQRLSAQYESYMCYYMVATMYSIPVHDPYSSWLKRRNIDAQIATDREHIEANEQARLHALNTKLDAVHSSYNGLIKILAQKDWDLITIISLRNSYEKRLAALSAVDVKKSLKRLALFEKVTKTFREEQIERLTADTAAKASLTTTHQITKEIDELLLTIFDLPNADKNRLLVLTKQARELTEERNQLLSERAERNLLITTSSF